MAQRSVTVEFEIDYDDEQITGDEVTRLFDVMLSEMLEGGESWPEEAVSDELGSPGVGRLEVMSNFPDYTQIEILITTRDHPQLDYVWDVVAQAKKSPDQETPEVLEKSKQPGWIKKKQAISAARGLSRYYRAGDAPSAGRITILVEGVELESHPKRE